MTDPLAADYVDTTECRHQPPEGTIKVLMSAVAIEQMFARDGAGNRLTVEMGEPDKDGCYVLTVTQDVDDNIVRDAIETEGDRILNALEAAIIHALETHLADDFRGVDLFYRAEAFARALLDDRYVQAVFRGDE